MLSWKEAFGASLEQTVTVTVSLSWFKNILVSPPEKLEEVAEMEEVISSQTALSSDPYLEKWGKIDEWTMTVCWLVSLQGYFQCKAILKEYCKKKPKKLKT